jgi:hypothetical protein
MSVVSKNEQKGISLQLFKVSEKLPVIKELLCTWIKNVRAGISPALVDEV